MIRRALPWLLLSGVALAASPDPRGWSRGTAASGTTAVVEGAKELPILPFPRELTDRVQGKTLLVYFSPTCPHCRKVAAELQALHVRLEGEGAGVLGVASGGAEPTDIDEFRQTFGITFPILQDTKGEIAAAMAARSTPSAMLVSPAPGKGPEKGRLQVRDVWYPYLPGWDALVEARVIGDVWKVFRPGEYLGNNVCGACHVEEHASWSLTFHSVAWHTLQEKEATAQEECVGCHVTGKGQPTGWGSGATTPLVDVGCEACHGPGGPHDGERVDAKTVCTTCHDAEHSIAFSVEKGLPSLDHFAASHLSDAERDQRREALWDGEAPRELLAFPEGNNVGSAKCRACHAVEYDQWADSPHARGMDSLRQEGHDDPACVRCHATAKTSGPPPTDVKGFDTFGGVGCESCHGPGEKHVAAGGGKDNIQGLGASCPVCVVEALCTSCHTPKWSPQWKLDPALDAVRHQRPQP